MAQERSFDLIVIGAGPGGYTACLRAAELGMKVACVEREPRLGGVCLRVGCIPTKALLESSERYVSAREGLADHGVLASGVSLDLAALQTRSQRVVEKLTDDVAGLLARAGVAVVRGEARLVGGGAVEVLGQEAGILRARHILLATGSEPAELPVLPFDGERIVGSTEALRFSAVPGHLAVVGGGYIGLELGSVWARLGSRVTVVEALPRIASQLDGQVGRALERSLRKQGLEIRTATRVAGGSVDAEGATLSLESESGAREELRCDRVLVAVGRRPFTASLGLAEAGVTVDPAAGRVRVDARYRTSADGVYAIGDLVDGPMLAHKASAEGIAAVEQVAGQPGEVNYDAIPSVIYTSPEAASVGLTEEQLKARSVPFRAGVMPFTGVGRAWCARETKGFATVLAHGRSGRVLGVHLLGPRASELIAEAVLAMGRDLSAFDLARAVHAHPTFSEALMEAARAAVRAPVSPG